MLLRTDFFDLWALMLDEGVPILHCFEIAAQELHGEELGEALVHMGREVSAGSNISDATREHPELFPAPISTYIGAWERSGTLESGLKRLVEAFASGEFPDPRESTITAALKRLTLSCEILMGAGMPLTEVFATLHASETNKKVADITGEVLEALEAGGSLGDAMGRHPEVFSAAYVALVHKAEVNGQLGRTFGKLSRGITRRLFLPPT